MSAVSDNDIISRLSKLSISHGEVLQHAPVSGLQDWRAELTKIGKGDVALTKTVRPAQIKRLAPLPFRSTAPWRPLKVTRIAPHERHCHIRRSSKV